MLHAASLSQVIACELLQQWGLEGFRSHVNDIENFYQKRRDIMAEAAKAHLTGLCEWSVPDGGMFLWMRVPDLQDTWDMLLKRGLEANIMLLPGHAFMPGGREAKKSSAHMRAAFSVAKEEDFDVAFQRLATLIKREIERQQK